MSPVDITATALEHLESMSTLHPDLSEQYQNLVGLYQRKLWHQLTMSTLEFVSNPSSTLRTTAEGTNSYLALFDKVILPIDKKMNQLTLARIASSVSFSLLDDPPYKDGVAARAILENLSEKRARLSPSAALHAESCLGLFSLTLFTQNGEALTTESPIKALGATRESINKNQLVLTELADTESKAAILHLAFYKTTMMYHKCLEGTDCIIL